MKPMTTDDPVRRALAALADADASRHAPPHLERAVLDGIDRRMNHGYFRRCIAAVWAYRHAAAAIALALIVTSAIYFDIGHVLDRSRGITQRVSDTRTTEHPSVRTGMDAFLTTPPEGEIAQRVLVRLPRAMLPMLGVPIINPDAPGTVNLEVVLTEDGLAKTIRIVP
jgi:hypothetical protein